MTANSLVRQQLRIRIDGARGSLLRVVRTVLEWVVRMNWSPECP
jgi:hypothetical protein